MRLSIFTKLSLFSIALVLLAGLGIGMLLHTAYQRALFAQQLRDLRYESHIDTGQILDSVAALRADLSFLNQLAAKPIHFQELAQTFLQNKPHYVALTYWYKQAGVWQGVRLRRAQGRWVKQAVAFSARQQALVKRLKPQQIELSRLKHVARQPLLLSAFRAQHNASAQTQSLLQLDLTLQPVLQALQGGTELPIAVHLSDAQGQLLYSSQFKHPAEFSKHLPQLRQWLAQPKSLFTPLHWRSAAHAAFVYVEKVHFDPNQPKRFFVLLLSVPVAHVFNRNTWLAKQTWETIAVLLVLTILLALLFAKRLTRALARITRSAEQVSQGDSIDYLPVQRRDEIGTLARAFALMLGKIKQRTQALEQSNAELSQFAYVASHDLKEPLRKVQTFGGFLQEEAGTALSPEAQAFLSKMVQAVERMRGLIDALLDYARISRRELTLVQVDLNVLIAEVCADLQMLIEEKQAQLTISAQLPSLEGDALQLRQLLQNLLANALKFHKPDLAPSVSIDAQVIPAQQSPLPSQVAACVLTVADKGIGFSADYADKAFQMFQRLHGHTQYAGTGIGLAVCKRIVERHAGTISVVSETDVGTRFTIVLPLQQQQDLATEDVLDAHIDG